MKTSEPKPEQWNIKVVKFLGGYYPKFKIGNQSFFIGISSTKKTANWIQKMLIKALRNLIYYELQRFLIFIAVNQLEDQPANEIIEKYLNDR